MRQSRVSGKKRKILVGSDGASIIKCLKKFTNNVGWVWIDTFKTLPINKKVTTILKKFKSCLVCPERWGRPKDIVKYIHKMKKINFLPDSVMTSKKYIYRWEQLINKF